jgi:LAO/AO transport system kinase
MLLCEAAGFQNILVETVGVGQSETAVHEMVDFFLLVMLAGAGDELQGIKRGVMELADQVAVNKADGANIAAAERARAEAQNALHFFPAAGSGWTPGALTCSALSGVGIREVWNKVLEYVALTQANGWFAQTRRDQQKRWMHEMIEQTLKQRFDTHPAVKSQMETLVKEVTEGRTTSFRAARKLLEIYADANAGRLPS